MLAGKPAFNFDKWTFGSPFWLNKAGERPAAAPVQAAGSVVFRTRKSVTALFPNLVKAQEVNADGTPITVMRGP